MAAVVAPEAARKISVPEVVRIASPGHSHLRKNITIPNRKHLESGSRYVGSAVGPDSRIAVLVVLLKGRGNALRGLVAGGVLPVQNLQRLPPRERQRRGNLSRVHGVVQSALWQFVGMGGAI